MSHALISVEWRFSMTLLRGADHDAGAIDGHRGGQDNAAAREAARGGTEGPR